MRDLQAAQPDEPRPDEATQRGSVACDAKLKQYRAALEAGADPVLVTNWINETRPGALSWRRGYGSQSDAGA